MQVIRITMLVMILGLNLFHYIFIIILISVTIYIKLFGCIRGRHLVWDKSQLSYIVIQFVTERKKEKGWINGTMKGLIFFLYTFSLEPKFFGENKRNLHFNYYMCLTFNKDVIPFCDCLLFNIEYEAWYNIPWVMRLTNHVFGYCIWLKLLVLSTCHAFFVKYN